MRLIPVPLLYYKNPELAIELSGKRYQLFSKFYYFITNNYYNNSSRTTHGSQLAIDACRYFGGLIVC